MTQIPLLTVPVDSPTRKQRLDQFKKLHGIETMHSPHMKPDEHPWCAMHWLSAKLIGEKYGNALPFVMFDYIRAMCRPLEENGILVTGRTEADAVRRLCWNMNIKEP